MDGYMDSPSLVSSASACIILGDCIGVEAFENFFFFFSLSFMRTVVSDGVCLGLVHCTRAANDNLVQIIPCTAERCRLIARDPPQGFGLPSNDGRPPCFIRHAQFSAEIEGKVYGRFLSEEKNSGVNTKDCLNSLSAAHSRQRKQVASTGTNKADIHVSYHPERYNLVEPHLITRLRQADFTSSLWAAGRRVRFQRTLHLRSHSGVARLFGRKVSTLRALYYRRLTV